jgi:hypothetical protein
MARPTTLTPELQARICAAVRTGLALGPAAESCGVSRRTVYEWLFRGRGDDQDRPATALYAAFAHEVETAAASAALKPIAGLIPPVNQRSLTITTEHLADGSSITRKVWQ